MSTKVSIGISSVIGWAVALLAGLPVAVKDLEAGKVALAGPEKYLAVASIVSLAITQIGRYLQAHAKAKAIAPAPAAREIAAPGKAAELPPVS